MISNKIYDFFEQDHRRVEGILEAATRDINNINLNLYQEFRVGLLTHIKMEEKVLFKAVQEANNGTQIEITKQLRLDHGAITTLLVPSPTPELIKVLHYILKIHDEIEEKEGGIYQMGEQLTEKKKSELLQKLADVKPVPIHPNKDSSFIMEVVQRTVKRAGYNYDEIVS